MAVIGQKYQTILLKTVESYEMLPVILQEQITIKDGGVAKRNYIIAKSEIKKTFSK